jgi:hypothetical protein
MGRGRRSGGQGNQATSGHELKKKRRSRTGKGINSRSLEPGSTSQGRKLVGGSRRVGTEARRQWAETEARRRRPVAGERGCGVTRRGCGARRGRAGVRGLDGGLGRQGKREKVSLTGLGRIHKADTYQPTYPIFAKIIKIRILRGYVSWAYRTRIHDFLDVSV